MISRIIPRRDNLNEKAMEVNRLLQNTCGSYNLYFIHNTNVNKESDLNNVWVTLKLQGNLCVGW